MLWSSILATRAMICSAYLTTTIYFQRALHVVGPLRMGPCLILSRNGSGKLHDGDLVRIVNCTTGTQHSGGCAKYSDTIAVGTNMKLSITNWMHIIWHMFHINHICDLMSLSCVYLLPHATVYFALVNAPTQYNNHKLTIDFQMFFKRNAYCAWFFGFQVEGTIDTKSPSIQ